jgi:hypothetical protein
MVAASAADAATKTAPALDPSAHDREVFYARELAEQQRRASEWERSYKAALRDLELATALAGRPLVPGAAAQLIKLWRDDFDVYEEHGVLKVTARDGRAVVQAVAERLAAPEYAHFCQAASRGGSATPGGSRLGPPGAAASGPQTLGEAAIRRWRESVGRHDQGTAPIGLHPRRR